MTYFEVKKSVTGLLRGDNSKAEEYLNTDETYLRMAFMDICIRCVPSVLVADWDETKTDVFRRVYSRETWDETIVYAHRYIRQPLMSIENDSIVDIDAELLQALIFFMCSYLTNKKDKNYVDMAEKVIKMYESNYVDIGQYDE